MRGPCTCQCLSKGYRCVSECFSHYLRCSLCTCYCVWYLALRDVSRPHVVSLNRPTNIIHQPYVVCWVHDIQVKAPNETHASHTLPPLTLRYPVTCSAMPLMCSMCWCSLRWYLRADSRASFCRVDTRASRDCSLLFHLSLAIRVSCSRVALFSSSASVAVRSASTQQCSPSLSRSSRDSGSPHPLRQTAPARWPVSGSPCDSIARGFETRQVGSFSAQGVWQSAHIARADNFSNERGRRSWG